MRQRCVIMLICACATVALAIAPAAEAVDGGDPLASARAIIALEHQRVALVAAWDKEQADLERLATARAIAIADGKARIAELKAQLEQRSRDAAERAAEVQRLADDQAAVRAVVQALATAWPALALPPVEGRPALELLRDAAAACDKLRVAATRFEVEVAEGVLPDGGTAAVQVLKAGLAAAWYASLDGRSGGIATRAGGRWTLAPDPDARAAAAAIGLAIAQLRGNTVPEAVLLPAPAGAAP
jgi:hypothetical protein